MAVVNWLAVHVSVAVYHYDQDTLASRQTEARLSDNTLCMIAVQGVNSSYMHYDVHSLYGASQIYPTLRSTNVDFHQTCLHNLRKLSTKISIFHNSHFKLLLM